MSDMGRVRRRLDASVSDPSLTGRMRLARCKAIFRSAIVPCMAPLTSLSMECGVRVIEDTVRVGMR
jgi:hypothetical protein